MTCDKHLWDQSDGLACVRTDTHTTHAYESAWAPDTKHADETEDQ